MTSDDAVTVASDDTVATSATVRDHAIVYLKGLAMGTADSIPGVSGGTIALITGIYERLITAITALHPRVLRHLLRVHTREGRGQLVGELRAMDVPFLLALGVGMVSGVVVVAQAAHYAEQNAPAATYAFFFGLIAASAVVLYSEVDTRKPGPVVAGVAGFLLAFLVAGVSGAEVLPNSLPVVFLTATVAISAMVLPGISGAAILLLLGQYDYLVGILSTFVDRILALAGGASVDALLEPGTVVATFLAGATVGVLTIAHLVKWALEAYRAATLAFLVSLLVGTLRLPVIKVGEAVGAWDAVTAGTVLATAVIGALAVLALDYFTDDLSY